MRHKVKRIHFVGIGGVPTSRERVHAMRCLHGGMRPAASGNGRQLRLYGVRDAT
jgi:hypothetical protein